MAPCLRGCLLFAGLVGVAAAPARALSAEIDYAREVKPLLQRKCYACHSAIRHQLGLRLDAGVLILKGGRHGPAVSPGKGGASLLIRKVSAAGADRMPPPGEGEALSPAEIALLKAWIDQGARVPADEEVPEDPTRFWSFQPPRRPAVPAVRNQGWVRTPVDAFVAAGHEKHGLEPAPPADRARLLRRVYLDLVGLPPTRAELHAFLADPAPDAYEKVVERLLASPGYGERWGRHWMDVWRYSDWYGSGNEIRYGQRHLWRWRSWIVQSLNADRGYDRMITEMLAGDEVAPADPDVLAATGFVGRNWYKFDRNVWMRDLVEHTAMGFLGLTLKCARCHDHKFDPISQEEYYRFRAFFEPHGVRADPISARAGLESYQDQGNVLKDGLARVYDSKPDAPTYLFSRGDDRYPEKDRPLTPGVPRALGGTVPAIEPISLPVEAYVPALRPELVRGMHDLADERVRDAEEELTRATQAVAAARKQLEEEKAGKKDDAGPKPEVPGRLVLRDDFSRPRPEVWKPVNGKWEYREGRLIQSQVGTFLTMTSLVDHPRDFLLRLRYRPLKEGGIHSVGIGFDVAGSAAMQAVYTWNGGGSSGVQTFHRQGGKEEYPPAGIVPHPIPLEEEITLDVAVQGSLLNVWVNGQLKVVYTMPLARQPGKLSLWNHSATAEYRELILTELPADVTLARQAGVPQASAFAAAGGRDPEGALALAVQGVPAAEKKLAHAQADRRAVKLRIEAEQARHRGGEATRVEALARAAAAAERQAGLLRAEITLLEAEQQIKGLPAAAGEKGKVDRAPAEAEKRLAAARKAVEAARAALKQTDGKYTPLGEVHPRTSTGRRLALARWIADPDNPRTARVAVNHIWLRHFGRALVEPVADFGLRARPRSHPELLDWLAVELAASGWSMKHVHRLIVLSSTYRLSSSALGGEASTARDPENRYLWRMNSRRMEAEVVRDSVLHLAGRLDRTLGGPELPASQGETSPRRSLYFQVAPNRQMLLLELFDGANPDECYERRPSVIPQQSLTLMNSGLALASSRELARQLSESLRGEKAADAAFVVAAFEQVLGRGPTPAEQARCEAFLGEQARLLKNPAGWKTFPPGPAGTASADPAQRARENLVHVLFNHNDFVTVR